MKVRELGKDLFPVPTPSLVHYVEGCTEGSQCSLPQLGVLEHMDLAKAQCGCGCARAYGPGEGTGAGLGLGLEQAWVLGHVMGTSGVGWVDMT